jgi:hypothetical protein
MYEVNYGLKNKIRRVIVLQRAPITQTARAKLVALGSPFGKYVLHIAPLLFSSPPAMAMLPLCTTVGA